MKSKHICPKCGGRKFVTTAHVTQSWVVDSYGDFIHAVTECDEVTHQPDDANIWSCVECGTDGVVINFSKPYIQACIENQVFIKTIDDYKEAWQSYTGDKKTFREYLGMTEDEYQAWTVTGNDVLKKIISCRKKGVPFTLIDKSNAARFNAFIELYKSGQYVYPDAIQRNTKMSMNEIYMRCNADETLKPAYVWRCPNCRHTAIYESLCDIPETICCEHCDAVYPVDISTDAEVIFKKI